MPETPNDSQTNRQYDKINLQTSFTDLVSVYYLLSVVDRLGRPLFADEARTTVFPAARARVVRSAGGEWDPGNNDTHALLTLRELNLVEPFGSDASQFVVSNLGRRLLRSYQLHETPNGTKVEQSLSPEESDGDHLLLLFEIAKSVRKTDDRFSRDIHPYRVLFQLLDDNATENKVTKREWARFLNEPENKTDSQYDSFLSQVLAVRGTQDEIQLKKSDRNLSMLKNWGLLKSGSETGSFCSYSVSSSFSKAINIMKEKYLSAIRTKPFILLAGISGTGKTRLVRQLARGCCHEPKLVSKETNTCGNYECIPVRPNWHDSTELLGYVTRITKNNEPPKYVVTPFVEFLAKAWTYRETPFFLCLDEMNLAPVEQYFAEYLSVVESRERITAGNGADSFECLSSREKLVRFDALEKETKDGLLKELFENKDWAPDPEDDRIKQVKAMFEKDGGIRLPPNLVVMGTVNMDETTCTFSRKVLDRAMSFELNEVEMKDGLDKPTETTFGAIPVSAATPSFLKPYEFYDDNKVLCDKVIDFLDAVNKALDATPFKIAYRSRDEIMLYCVERTQGTGSLAAALDEATSMKILSRIEGDENRFKTFSLAKFRETIALGLLRVDNPAATEADAKKKIQADEAVVETAKRSPSLSKLGKMIDDLGNIGAVSFWD